VAYKRLDLAIKAGELVGLPVVIVGGGPEEASLRVLSAHASVPVHFLGSVSNELLYAVYQRAAVFVFPAIEDFGILPVEAMALGTPVVVSEVGGAMESLDHVGGGLTFDIDSPSDLKSAVSAAIGLRGSGFEHSADFYSAAAFDARIKAWLP
jgi:glycosyltransferase involved in cell wall biosynthesis